MYFVHKIVTRVSTVSHDQHHMILIYVASCDNEFSSQDVSYMHNIVGNHIPRLHLLYECVKVISKERCS